MDVSLPFLAASAVRNQNNEALYFISQLIDITAQKKAEKQLAETHQNAGLYKLIHK
jgi:mannitol/fructose-specific phosphotransferase system IIA component (Ntr-type)